MLAFFVYRWTVSDAELVRAQMGTKCRIGMLNASSNSNSRIQNLLYESKCEIVVIFMDFRNNHVIME